MLAVSLVDARASPWLASGRDRDAVPTWQIQGIKMNNIQLSDIEYINLTALTAIRIGIQQDKASACIRFALDASEADLLGQLSTEQIWAIVTNVGPVTLFPPRHDLLRLLQTPLPLTAPLAAVRPSRPVAPQFGKQ
jgi:hypothetical protein